MALRQEQLWAADADIRASERNTALVATLEQSLTALREQKQSTARRDVERWQQQLHGKQLEELHRLRGALVDVQARRQRAQLEFEAEMHSREEAARCEQELRQELELEHFDAATRSAARLGVDAEIAAAETAVEDGVARAVRQAAQQTQAALEAQVR